MAPRLGATALEQAVQFSDTSGNSNRKWHYFKRIQNHVHRNGYTINVFGFVIFLNLNLNRIFKNKVLFKVFIRKETNSEWILCMTSSIVSPNVALDVVYDTPHLHVHHLFR